MRHLEMLCNGVSFLNPNQDLALPLGDNMSRGLTRNPREYFSRIAFRGSLNAAMRAELCVRIFSSGPDG
jgi:hypothetical protein